MEQRWIPVSERLPDADKYILVSFKNSTISDIGRYETDKDGSGAFYPGDDDKSYVEYALFLNAWMPLPEPFRESEEELRFNGGCKNECTRDCRCDRRVPCKRKGPCYCND